MDAAKSEVTSEPSRSAVMDEMLSHEDACAMLKCEWSTLRTLLHDGHLPGLKVSKEWVIPRRAFTQRINELALQEAAETRAEREQERASATPPTIASPTYELRLRDGSLAVPQAGAKRYVHHRWKPLDGK